MFGLRSDDPIRTLPHGHVRIGDDYPGQLTAGESVPGFFVQTMMTHRSNIWRNHAEKVIIGFGGHNCSRSSIRSHFIGFAREAPGPGKTCRESCDESFLGDAIFYRLSAGEAADA
jgi:hypothetical protein